MKRLYILLLLVLIQNSFSSAQAKKDITTHEIKSIVEKIADSLEYYYVDLKEGKKIGMKLKENERLGMFSHIKNPDTLAHKLTQVLRSVNGDLHLSITHSPKNTNNTNTSDKLENQKLAYAYNYGVPEVKILDGNIGYMKISSFSNWDFFEQSKSKISTSMKFLENSDAIIFDVRDNRGGVPNLVAFLCSYLFKEERVHLAQYYHRYRNNGYGLYTYKYIPGRRIPETPIFILVNNKSASAAEEFAYFLKHRKRATIIGEATMGAGYGVMSHRINDRFVAYISSEEDINPITKTNFEGVGVIPNIKIENHNAFDTTKDLANEAAKKYRINKFKYLQTLIDKYTSINKDLSISTIINTVKKCQKEGLISRTDINRLGYKFLENKPSISEAVFQLNTKLYPMSSNVFDSYGDGLKAVGKLKQALNNYKKAIEVGKLIGSSNMAVYLDNVKAVEQLIAEKKSIKH